jgi:60 kDa SS-A/Ro ribonucleoprotein
MLRNFVQMIRSGVTGRRGMGSAPKKLVQGWLQGATDNQVFRGSVGNQPSMGDIIKLVHPCPKTPERDALYSYLLGKTKGEDNNLPPLVKDFESFKLGGEIPQVPFEMLTATQLTTAQWKQIALNAGWHWLRMNLNTMERHGLWGDAEVVEHVAKTLRDPGILTNAKIFPYQLMTSYMYCSLITPKMVLEALEEALEMSSKNIPIITGNVVVCPDVSGSMGSPITGYRPGATSEVRCIDVAGLIASCLLRTNPQTEIIPFEGQVVTQHRGRPFKISAKDTIFTNAEKLARIGGGSTNCSAPLVKLNLEDSNTDVVIFISDYESWVSPTQNYRSTDMMTQWKILKERNPQAKLICMDLTPRDNVQVPPSEDVLNVGGFSDNVWPLMTTFLRGEVGGSALVQKIKEVVV